MKKLTLALLFAATAGTLCAESLTNLPPGVKPTMSRAKIETVSPLPPCALHQAKLDSRPFDRVKTMRARLEAMMKGAAIPLT